MPGRRIRKRGQGYLYRDRIDAGQRLVERLGAFQDADTLVLALPRGGVPVAAEVARALDAELDVMIARKIGAPMQPELAIGAVTADGGLFLDTMMVRELGIEADTVDALIAAERENARQREGQFRGDRAFPGAGGRTVILVDDGLATGATMSAAVHAVRKLRPDWLVVAVPVGSRFACEVIGSEVNEIFCLATPEPFGAVGLFYRDFLQTEDAQVERILEDFRGRGRTT
jgi:predicted phosphoribosyltransferase